MKFKLKMIVAIAMAAFVATFKSAAGLGDPQNILSYTGGDGYYYSSSGTNSATGYTNTAVYVDTSKVSSLSFYVQTKGFSANSSNNITLVVYPAFSSASADQATTAIARIALAPGGNTGITVITNVTSVYCPAVKVQLEDPSTNPVRLTNVVVRVFGKTP